MLLQERRDDLPLKELKTAVTETETAATSVVDGSVIVTAVPVETPATCPCSTLIVGAAMIALDGEFGLICLERDVVEGVRIPRAVDIFDCLKNHTRLMSAVRSTSSWNHSTQYVLERSSRMDAKGTAIHQLSSQDELPSPQHLAGAARV